MYETNEEYLWWMILAITFAVCCFCILVERFIFLRWARRPRPSVLGILGRSFKNMLYLQAVYVVADEILSFFWESSMPKFVEIEDKVFDVLGLFSLIIIFSRLSKEIIISFVQKDDDNIINEGFAGSSLLVHISDIIVYTGGVLMILQYLGLAVAPLVTALGVGGLSIGLALRDTLSNLFAGIYMLVTKNIRVGDTVRLSSGEKGRIVDITWRQMTLCDSNNNSIIIPNEKVAGSAVLNYSWPTKNARIDLSFPVIIECDLLELEKMLYELLYDYIESCNAGLIRNPKVLFRNIEVREDEKKYQVVVRVSVDVEDVNNEDAVRHELIKIVNGIVQKELTTT